MLGDVEIGQQLRDRWVRIQPAAGAAHWAQIVWATRDSLTLVGLLGAVAAGDTFAVVVAPGSADLYVFVDGDGNPIAAFAADGSPLPNTISGAVITRTGRSTVVDGLAGLTPGELVGATIEIVGGAGAGQRRTVIANTATSITVGRPWDVAPAAGSAYEVRRYDGLVVRSVAVTIEDNDIAGVAIVVTGADTRVTEGAPAGHPGVADRYEVVLTRQPDADVMVTITTDGQTEVRRFGVGSFGPSLELTFTPGTWNVAQVVELRAFADTLIEGAQIQVISHTVSSDPAVESDDTASRTDTIVEPDAVSTILLSERPMPGSAVTVTAEGGSSNQIQRVVVGTEVVGGSYFLTFGGERTRRIRFDASAAAVKGALEALATVGDITVVRLAEPGFVFLVAFLTPPGGLIEGDGAELVAGVTVTDDGVAVGAGRFVVEENTLTFNDEFGSTEYRSGTFVVSYGFRVPGFDQVPAPSIDVRVDDDDVASGCNERARACSNRHRERRLDRRHRVGRRAARAGTGLDIGQLPARPLAGAGSRHDGDRRLRGHADPHQQG